jgi:hypothetical protein
LCTYLRFHQTHSSPCGSLIDGGDNGDLSGGDVVVFEQTFIKAHVTGIAYNTLNHIPILKVAGLTQSHDGTIIGIFHQQ